MTTPIRYTYNTLKEKRLAATRSSLYFEKGPGRVKPTKRAGGGEPLAKEPLTVSERVAIDFLWTTCMIGISPCRRWFAHLRQMCGIFSTEFDIRNIISDLQFDD